ncbi:MAG TPA: SMI1/KNR4 family protein [Terriglobales bacterium]
MNPLIELLQKTDGALFVNQDGLEDRLELLPPLAGEELNQFEASLPCPIPEDMRELLAFARGFKIGGGLEEISFYDLEGIGLEEIFPRAVSLAADGFGNYWVVDLTSESRSWGPIFYACHDAPVIVFQTDSLLHFVQEAIRFGNKPWKSEINDVHEGLSTRIWRDNPNVLSFESCIASQDPDLRDFAQSLNEKWEFIDLRNPKLGEGFSWGRYGPKTRTKRFGEKRIFACEKRSLGRRFLDVFS